MQKIKVHLFGRHSNRTPLAYETYKGINKQFQVVEDVEASEIIILGFVKDVHDNFERLLAEKKKQKLIFVVSEEPLWDSQFSGGYLDIHRHIEKGGETLSFIYLNHMNSSIFDYHRVPYFITTESKYINRYRVTLSRYLNESFSEFSSRLNRASYKTAFIIEKRIENYFDKSSELKEVKALSVYRSKLAESLFKVSLVQGKGWGDEDQPRQGLVDWHLDKLSLLQDNCQIISALENTYHKLYISEKFFDAIACGGIPLTYHCNQSKFFKGLNPGGYLNVFDKTIPDALKLIQSLSISPSLYSAWRENLNKINLIFSDNRLIFNEKVALSDRLATEIRKYM